jgi:hypothetical protein
MPNDPRTIDLGLWNQNPGPNPNPAGGQFDPVPDWWLENLYRTGWRPTGPYPTAGGGTSDAWNPAESILENLNPDFDYWERNTTQSDINTSDLMGDYEDQFQAEAERYGSMEDELFQNYMAIQNQMMMDEETGSSGALDEAIRGALFAGQSLGGAYFGGTAGESDTFQGQYANALSSIGQGGGAFGYSGGDVQGLPSTIANRGNQLTIERMAQTMPQLFGSINIRDVGMLNTLSNTLNSGQYGALRANAIESAYGAGVSSAESPFLRSGERDNREYQQEELDFFRRAQPSILTSLERSVPGTKWEDRGNSLLDTMLRRGFDYSWDRWGPGGSQWQDDPRQGDGYQYGPTRYGSPYRGDTGYGPPGYDGYTNTGGGGGGYEQPGGYVDHWDPNSYNPYRGHEDAERNG